MLTLASNNMTMLESVIINIVVIIIIIIVVTIIVVIVQYNTGKQYDGIGRHLDDIGRQHESQSGDWQQIT